MNSEGFKRRLTAILSADVQGYSRLMREDEEAQRQAALLDGCYTLETDVAKEKLSAEQVDARYRDLQRVERHFRTIKTGLLEVRPFFVRKESRTRGHVFAAMLALKVVREMHAGLAQAFGTTDDNKEAVTLDDALAGLSRLCYQIYDVKQHTVQRLPRPDERQRSILDALGICWPAKTTSSGPSSRSVSPGL